MTKEIGPREKQLREIREARYGKSTATMAKVAALKEKIATIKPKPKKAKRK